MNQTLFDKIWDYHIVPSTNGEAPIQLYIDAHYIHEVTSPQAFDVLRERGWSVFRANQTFATADHNIPTLHQDQPIKDDSCRIPVETLAKNCELNHIEYFPMLSPQHGIVHVMGPEQGITQPGMTIVCGDSHTATHGAFGSIAFGIGTSEVAMVLATQTLFQNKPKQMRITINGKLDEHVTPKDVILYIISQLGAAGATGYFVEYAGEVFEQMSMEGRMTVCNMSIEMGARGGLIAPDETTFDYVLGRPKAPKDRQAAIERWSKLYSDADATFDKEFSFAAENIGPMITWGTTPGHGVAIGQKIPSDVNPDEQKALDYMGFKAGENLEGHTIDYVFVGSCTNGRIEDFREFAHFVKGKQKHSDVTVWLVPGSAQVEEMIKAEGLLEIFEAAGMKLRQPGCSACLAMNDDKIPAGKYALSTSNRNFEGRQGPGARTILCGPAVAAMGATEGKILKPSLC